LTLLALAYCGSSGAAGIVGLMFVVPLLTVPPLIAAALRTDLPPRLIAVPAFSGAAGAAAIAAAEFTSTGTSRVGEWVANPIHFADLALLVGFLAVLGTLFGRGPGRWLFLLAPLLATVAVLLSGTRGALVALVAMLGAAVLAGLVMRQISLRHLAVGAVVVLIGLFAAWVGGVGQTSAVQRVMVDIADVFR